MDEAGRDGRSSMMRWGTALLLLLVGCGLYLTLRVGAAHGAWEDAVMFLRYALEVRNGYGISWNPGGPHSAGLTSPLWLVLVVLAVFAHHDQPTVLVYLSTFSGVAAIALMAAIAHAVVASKRWPVLAVFGVLFGSLLLAEPFRYCLTNGMETMLGMFMTALLMVCARHFAMRETSGSALLFAAVSVLSVLVRPESGLCAVTLAASAWWWSGRERRVAAIGVYGAAFALGIGLVLAANQAYFKVMVPLPFYIKQRNGYIGFSYFPDWIAYALGFVESAWLPVLLLLLLIRRRDLRSVATYLVPFGVMFAYLCTVTQITGVFGRYYMPYLPLLVVAAYVVLDRAVTEPAGRHVVRRAVVVVVVVVVSGMARLPALESRIFFHVERARHLAYPEAKLETMSPTKLPELPYGQVTTEFGSFASSLPGHPRFALTEAGYSSVGVPDSYVLDMAGLNDTYIALHGQSSQYILDQKPDVIWMPDMHYTWLRGQLFTDPRMLAEYDVYAGAFNYGLAIRKDANNVDAIREKFNEYWKKLYKGDPEQYRVRSVTWDSRARYY